MTLELLAIVSILYLLIGLTIRSIRILMAPYQAPLPAYLQAKRLIFQRKDITKNGDIHAQKAWLEEAKRYLGTNKEQKN